MQTRYKADTKQNMLTFANMMLGIYPKIPQGRYSDLLGCMLENDGEIQRKKYLCCVLEKTEGKHMEEQVKSMEEVKQYLNSCLSAKREVEQLETDIAYFRAEKMSVRHTLDGMPRGSDHKDLSEYIVKLEELEKKLLRARYKRVAIYTQIFDQIEKMEDDMERELLTYRYLKGHTWEKVADEMYLSYGYCHKVHNKALEHFASVCTSSTERVALEL